MEEENNKITTDKIIAKKPDEVSTNYEKNILYNTAWKESEGLLLYKNNDFEYNPNIVIIEINDIIRAQTKNDFYTDFYIKKHMIETGNQEYSPSENGTIESYKFEHKSAFFKLRNNSISVIVLSNQHYNTKFKFDHIKQKINMFEVETGIPLFCMFALSKNCFMKPHTKMWAMVQYYYKKQNRPISKFAVIGRAAGEVTHQEKHNSYKIINKDTDRAFASNIGAEFLQYNKFVLNDARPTKFKWTSHIIPPEVRKNYILKLTDKCGRDVLTETAERSIFEIVYRRLIKMPPADTCIIMVFGSPTSGKTTVARDLIKEAEKHPWGKNNSFIYIPKKNKDTARAERTYSDYLDKRFNLLFDGEFANNKSREMICELARKFKSNLIYLEINPGIEMAKLFNHVNIETNGNIKTQLRNTDDYYSYRGNYIKPVILNEHEEYILYHPKIITSEVLLNYRF